MAALPRVLQRIFGSSGATVQFGQIGSEAAGAIATTKDLTTIQSLAQYLAGLYSITANLNEPPRGQDLNSLYFLITSQLAYLMQSGIPEYEAGTNYYADKSICQSGGIIYKCILGSDATPNINHTPASSPTYWAGIDAASVSQYGIGTASKYLDPGFDLDALTRTGFYVGGTLLHAPTTEFYHIINQVWDVPTQAFGRQTIFSMNTGIDSEAKMYTRSRLASGDWGNWMTIWNSGNDGFGSGLEADTVPGYGIGTTALLSSMNIDLNTMSIGGSFWIDYTAGHHWPAGITSACSLFVLPLNADNCSQLLFDRTTTGTLYARNKVSSVWSEWSKIWSSNNDGTGSGLDADLVRGAVVLGGAYTPEITSVLGITGTPTPSNFMYTRIGNIISVSGHIAVTASTTSGSSLGISLPIAKEIADNTEVSGVGSHITATYPTDCKSGFVLGSSTNDRATFIFSANAPTTGYAKVSFSYSL